MNTLDEMSARLHRGVVIANTFPAKELLALIELITDPYAAKERLAEISAARADLESIQRTVSDQLEIAEKASSEASVRKAEAEAAEKLSRDLAKKAADDLRHLKDRTEAAGIAIAKEGKEVDKARAALDYEISKLANREEAFKASVAAAEQAMKAREEAVAEREEKVKVKEESVANEKAMYNKRATELRKLAVG